MPVVFQGCESVSEALWSVAMEHLFHKSSTEYVRLLVKTVRDISEKRSLYIVSRFDWKCI